ncbi:unnamed protein product, partial [marine sediment metagenome]
KFLTQYSFFDLDEGNEGLVDLIIAGKLIIQGDPNRMVWLTSARQPCLFWDDMESGGGKWAADSPWGIVSVTSPSRSRSLGLYQYYPYPLTQHYPRPYPITQPYPHYPSGTISTTSHQGTQTNCWADSPSGNYSNYERSWLKIKDPLDFSNVQDPYLQFWTKYCSESYDDYLSVRVSLNNWSSWDEVARYSGNSYSWIEKTVDLDQYGGYSNVRIGFYLYSDSYSTYEGFYLDDIEVRSDHVPLPGDWGSLILTSASDSNSSI